MIKIFKRIYNSARYRLTNNLIINNLLIFLRLDSVIKPSYSAWLKFSCNPNKTLEENIGFTPREDVHEAIRKAHKDLNETVTKFLHKGDSILDIGCGPGLYLNDLKGNYKLFGIDISSDMVKEAKKLVPEATIYCADFFGQEFKTKFHLISSIGYLEYVPRSLISKYFKKIYELLEPNGILFMHYPHALSFYETLIPNIYYINYSPKFIEKICKKYFTIIQHTHCFDGRTIGRYDKIRYGGINGSFKNGCLIIAQKT